MSVAEIHSVATLTCMISQYWPTACKKEGATLSAVQWVLQHGFFSAFQTVEIPFFNERRAISELLRSHNLYLDYCVARVLNENQGNLSSLNEVQRTSSVQLVKEQLAYAHQAGACSVSLVSGKRPNRWSDRAMALEALQQSMTELVRYTSSHYRNISLLLEPLDARAHKQQTLGYLTDAMNLCHNLQQEGFTLGINVDTAHCWLNEEDPIETLQAVHPFVREYHFSNCITDPTNALCGDYHMAFGEPGHLTQSRMADILRQLLSVGFLNTSEKPYLLLEAIKPTDVSSETHLQNCQQFFVEALAMV